MRYKRLLAEMLVRGITKSDLAELLGKSERTIFNRFRKGQSDFTYNEAQAIRNKYFKGENIDYLFFEE